MILWIKGLNMMGDHFHRKKKDNAQSILKKTRQKTFKKKKTRTSKKL